MSTKETTRRSKDHAGLSAKQRAQLEFEAHQRAYEAFRRERCTHWLFWELCGHKACWRHRACVGDVGRCFDRFYPLVAEPEPSSTPAAHHPRPSAPRARR